MTKESGIYCIKNLINNKIYIGSAIHLNERRNTHFSALKKNKHCNKHLQASFNKYGEENFEFIILRIVKNKELLIRFEQVYINKSKCFDRQIGFNKRKIADSNLGNIISKQGRKNMSNAKKGTKMHPNTALAIKNSINPRAKGCKHSEEARKKKSIRMKLIWSNRTKEEIKILVDKIQAKQRGRKKPSAKISEICLIKATLIKLKPIIQYDMNNIFIKEWSSIKECCEANNLTDSLVSKVLKGNRIHTRGYKFKYKNEANSSNIIRKEDELQETPNMDNLQPS